MKKMMRSYMGRIMAVMMLLTTLPVYKVSGAIEQEMPENGIVSVNSGMAEEEETVIQDGSMQEDEEEQLKGKSGDLQPIIPADQAREEDNGLYWIEEGATYKSGFAVLFYATGAGYGPEESQETDPINRSTRYVPVSWSVGNLNGKWTTYSEKTKGHVNDDTGVYEPGEYRFKGSFLLDTSVDEGAVSFTLEVSYQRQIYNGATKTWDAEDIIAYKTVDFYIKNVQVTPSPVIPVLQAPKISELENLSTGVSLKWTKTVNASGYNIYRKKAGEDWRKIASVRGRDRSSYTDKAVKGNNGVRYLYSVQSYNGDRTSTYDKTSRQILRLTAPALSGSSEKVYDEMAVKWKRNTKAGGYQLQYSTSASFQGGKIINIDSEKTTSKTVKGLKKKKDYHVRIRSSKKIGNTIYYSAWSGRQTIETKTPDVAKVRDNGLYWINEGATYRAGANLQFYATGAGYGPEEPQQVTPIRNSTRYVPVSWNMGTISGSWRRYTNITVGSTNGNYYIPGEYRFKGSFTVNTASRVAVPCTLRVIYRKQIYNGKAWKGTKIVATKQVRFYIKNVSY